jgi:hypothetical protein
VPLDLHDKDWLEKLVVSELDRYDAEAMRARLPTEVRVAPSGPGDLAPAARLLVARSLRARGPAPESPRAAFEDAVRADVTLVLDLALLAGAPPDPARRRVEVAAFLAAALGHDRLALAADPSHQGGPPARAVRNAFRAAAKALAERFHPPGDPKLGLPLYPGALAVLRRRLARVAMGHHRHHRLEREALARHRAYSEAESVLLVEALSALARAAASSDGRARAVRLRQLERLGLPRSTWRAARQAATSPREVQVIAAAAPERVRPFLLEQLLLAPLRTGWPAPESARFAEAFAAAAGLGPETLAGAQVEASARNGDLFQWFDALEPQEWEGLADEWGAAADQMVERLSSVVMENLGAIATEIRETGELGGLLAKAAAGRALSPAEKRKMKSQLIDLAKAVPALAILAAPGGMLLLPLLAKLLPFNLLPSAWGRHEPPPPPTPAPARTPPPRRS